MFKVLKKIVIACLLFCFVFSMAGCKKDMVKVTFKQTGWTDVIREVKRGETLIYVPNPKIENGYDIVWDRTDFTNLQENIIVREIRTPKKFTITYNLGSRQGDDFAKIESYQQTVTYKENVVTFKPSCSGYSFLGWEVKNKNIKFTDGVYTYAEDIVLIASWEVCDTDDDRFSPIIPSN